MTPQVGFLIVTSCQPATDAGEYSYTQKLVNLLAAGDRQTRKCHLEPQTTTKSTGDRQSWVTIGSKQKLKTPSKVSSLINSKHIHVLPQRKLVADKIKSLAQLGSQQPQRDRLPPRGKVNRLGIGDWGFGIVPMPSCWGWQILDERFWIYSIVKTAVTLWLQIIQNRQSKIHALAVKALRGETVGRVSTKGERSPYRSLGWELGVVSSTKVSRSFRHIYLETYSSGSTEPKSVVLSLWGGDPLPSPGQPWGDAIAPPLFDTGCAIAGKNRALWLSRFADLAGTLSNQRQNPYPVDKLTEQELLLLT